MTDQTRDRTKYNEAVRLQLGDRAEHQAWREGRVRPFVITQALNVRQLDGPFVDELCGTSEPAVDMWEDGQLYPAWEELKALADLTDYPVAFFTTIDHEPIGIGRTTLRFHLPRGSQPVPPPVLCFEPAAIEAATGTTRCPWCARSSRPVVSLSEFRVRS